MIQHEAKIPEAGNHGADARSRCRRDRSGAAFREEEEQVEVGAGGEFSSSVAARRNRSEWGDHAPVAHSAGYRFNVQQVDHHAVRKSRPTAQIFLGRAARFEPFAQDVMRLRDQRSKQSHLIEPFAGSAFAGKGAQCVTDRGRRRRARIGVRRAGVGACWPHSHTWVVIRRGKARFLVRRNCEQRSESSSCHGHGRFLFIFVRARASTRSSLMKFGRVSLRGCFKAGKSGYC